MSVTVGIIIGFSVAIVLVGATAVYQLGEFLHWWKRSPPR